MQFAHGELEDIASLKEMTARLKNELLKIPRILVISTDEQDDTKITKLNKEREQKRRKTINNKTEFPQPNQSGKKKIVSRPSLGVASLTLPDNISGGSNHNVATKTVQKINNFIPKGNSNPTNIDILKEGLMESFSGSDIE